MTRITKFIRIRNARGQLLFTLRKCQRQARGCRRYQCRLCGELIPVRDGSLWRPDLCLDCRVIVDRAYEAELRFLESLT